MRRLPHCVNPLTLFGPIPIGPDTGIGEIVGVRIYEPLVEPLGEDPPPPKRERRPVTPPMWPADEAESVRAREVPAMSVQAERVPHD